MAKTVIKPVSKGLNWLTQILALFASKQIVVPTDFKDRCCNLEDLLESDFSGLVNSIVDFAITSAQVDFSVESTSKTLEKRLNDWLLNVNSDLRGKVPTGIDALAKQYYLERWKKSSLIVLRTIWETRDTYRVPVKLYFVDGKNVEIDDDKETKELGKESYRLRISKEKTVPLNNNKNEKIFVQKPFEDWGCTYPTPFLVKRGVYYNLKFLELITERGSNVVAKALEYLMLLKKGDPELAKLNRPEFIYDKAELTEIKQAVQSIMDEARSNGGMPLYSTNFDTQIEHLIPEYKQILDGALSAPVERRILGGLGFIEVVEGITSTRKDAIINPQVFVSEVNAGVKDFKALLHDVLMTVVEENKEAHRKQMNSDVIQIRTSPVKSLFSVEVKEYLRGLYDRGLLSKRTITELTGDVDFDAEVDRRKEEISKGIDEKTYPCTMYPPIIQNQVKDEASGNPDDPNGEKIPDEKKGPEAKNFTSASKKK